MKKSYIISAIFTFLLIPNLFAQDRNVSELIGSWKLSKRICQSKAPVLDNFNPKRDTMNLELEASSTFDFKQKINGCTYFSSGRYLVKNIFIEFFDITGASNCGPVTVFSKQVNAFEIVNNEVKLFYGPFNRGPAPCPMGDILIHTYTRE